MCAYGMPPFPAGAVTLAALATLPGHALLFVLYFNCFVANVSVPVGGYKSARQPVFTYFLLLFEDIFK